MKDSKKITRRRHSAELKARVLGECAQPGASVARVALSRGINANVVHKWRSLAGAAPLPVAFFLPVGCQRRLARRRLTFAWNCAGAQRP
jgi:transposase